MPRKKRRPPGTRNLPSTERDRLQGLVRQAVRDIDKRALRRQWGEEAANNYTRLVDDMSEAHDWKAVVKPLYQLKLMAEDATYVEEHGHPQDRPAEWDWYAEGVEWWRDYLTANGFDPDEQELDAR